MTETILTLMLLLVPPKAQPEPLEQAQARYSVIAQSIAAVAVDDLQLARFMVTIAKHESSFRKDVHSGKVRGDGGWAWGLFQFNNGSHLPEMSLRKNTKHQMLFFGKARARQSHIVGTSPRATKRAAVAAAFYLRPIIDGCQGVPLCVFKVYGGVSNPKGKVLKRLRGRVATYQKTKQQ